MLSQTSLKMFGRGNLLSHWCHLCELEISQTGGIFKRFQKLKRLWRLSIFAVLEKIQDLQQFFMIVKMSMKILYLHWVEVTPRLCKFPSVMWLTCSGFHDIALKSTATMSVIASFWKGRSHNPVCNETILRLSSSLTTLNLTIEPSYIQSAFNEASGLSRGILGTPDSHLSPYIVLADPLKPCLDPL